MKKVLTLLALAAVVGLFSCSNGGEKITNLIAIPTGDTTSLGSTFEITFNNEGTDSEYFAMHDLVVNNSPVFAMTANSIINPNDSFYSGKIQIIDYTKTEVAMNLTVYRDSFNAVGNYWVVTNGSTLTDYSKGQNLNYSIGPGSYVTYTALGTNFSYGSFYLNIIYNYKNSTAYGTFQIFK